MNKKEVAEMERLRTLLALRHSPFIEPDLHPDSNKGRIFGWSINKYNKTVYKTWSDSVYHGDGWPLVGSETRASQKGISMYSNRSQAYQALRSLVAMIAAEELRTIELKEQDTADEVASEYRMSV
ncbi:hypothetical protein NFB50_16090 [Yersinia ruckeri]|uniref:hypothetical protein n=1 Tax=Yersinia ruckeri TaxID=29486 RepID=UPI0020BE3DF0|nr:hypothetical protein [Yersinia ruckeri]HDL6787545.1 hypothetical protein [Yersinia enterocolitica]MCW6559978.1 hypothetical protein [Yersinia ruckeri]MCW6596013.1 hypothetical protein [Yersinia ruckeri]UZY16853.1 hypothetical protein LNQ37_017895 [Yersinia ruckeri]HDM8387214.1 hypothetical protein [Yersinia enterocolitica]